MFDVKEVSTPNEKLNQTYGTITTHHADGSLIHGPSVLNVTSIGWTTFSPPSLRTVRFENSAIRINVVFDRETDRGKRRLTCGSDAAKFILDSPQRTNEWSQISGSA